MKRFKDFINENKEDKDSFPNFLEEVKKVSTGEELKVAWANNGADFPAMTSAQFATFVHNEIKRWASVVKASGAKLD